MWTSVLRIASDEDLLQLEPGIDDGKGGGWFPRSDVDSNFVRSWDTQHDLAMEALERRLRSKRTYAEPFEMGRVGERSRQHLRRAAAAYALHYIFVAADTQGDPTGFFARKAAHYLRMGDDVVEAESLALDYDETNDGTLSEGEKQRPVVSRFLRA